MSDEQNAIQPTPETPGEEEKQQQKSIPETPLGQFVYHQKLAAAAALKALNALIPPEFKTHSAEASKEFATSFQVLIDSVNETITRELNRWRGTPQDSEKKGGPSTTGKTKVKVEVS